MSLMRLVTSEVKLMLRSRARTTMLLVATRVCAWAVPAATASASDLQLAEAILAL
jgi:hypothetical protein